MAIIIGTIGDDDLTGTSGDDTIYGYNPNDQANTDGCDDTLNGAGGNDSLFGGNGRDTLTGGAGNDILNGGPGGDTIAGGEGDDIYYASGNYYPDQRDVVVEAPNGGIDTIVAATSYVLPANVENLTLTAFASSGTGNELDNIIIGTGGDDFLYEGPGGLDTLIGGAGNDYYEITRSTTAVIEDADSGKDRLWIEVDNDYVLPAFVEDGTVGNSASIGLSGNELANTLRADEGDQRLYGLGGNDSLYGGRGDDILVGGDGDDILVGGAGAGDTADYSSASGSIFFNVEVPQPSTGGIVTGGLVAIASGVSSTSSVQPSTTS
jgi:Ca2+-binding RTX toxin-like protein